jgi:glycosyltransferase involved in cell wall biosynthesis
MRICMLTTSFPRHRGDFAGVFVYNMARELARRGVEVRVVAPHDNHIPRHEVHDRLYVYRFAYAWPWGWQRLAYGDGIPNNLRRRPWTVLQVPGFVVMFLRAAWRVCADCDIVHVHWAPLAWLGLALRLRYRIPVVLTVHGTDVRSLLPFLIRPALARVEAVVAAATETEVLLRRMGVTRYHLIPLPIDEEAFQPGMDPGALVEEIGLRPGDEVVTFIGRLDEFKDPLTLIRAASLVLAQRPQTHFVIVGDGPLAPDLRAAVANLGLRHAVHLMGARGDVGRYLALSKIFVALSPVENAWSMTIAEAMHMRVPCIITRAGQTERVFTHLQDSYLVEPKNEARLAEAIIYVLSSEDKRRQLIQGALALLQRHGKDTESIMQRMLALYQAVLDGKARKIDVRR